jgi:hypothetical protein
MKKKHLWFLLPLAFAMIFAELMIRDINISLTLLSLGCMIYTALIALIKNE